MEENILNNLLDSKGSLDLFDLIHESSSNSESSSDEEEKAENLMLKIDNLSEQDFKAQFTLNRSTVDYIVARYSKYSLIPNMPKRGGRPRIGCRKEVLIFLSYLGTPVSFTKLGELFEIPQSSAWFAVTRVSRWLVSIGDEYIKWPPAEEVKENVRKFGAIQKMPGVLGVINCTRIETNCTAKHLICPKKKKKNIHIAFQAVVDADKRFIDIDMSSGNSKPGPLHNNRILRKSILYKKAQADYKDLFHYNTFLIGSSAYSNSNWLIVPFSEDKNLTDRHKKFNSIHLSTQKVASDAFALLKRRFKRVVKFSEQKWIKGAMNIVASACILHNMSINMGDDFEIPLIEEMSNEMEKAPEAVAINTEIDRRQLLFDYMSERKII